MRLVFAGTPQPAVPVLRALIESAGHEVVAVLTRPPAPAGRGRREHGSPVAALAAEHGIAVLCPADPADPQFLAALAAHRPDCCPVVAYGALLRAPTLAVPAHGWVNLHFSLLPAWRGAAPVQHAILHGDDVTGASTFLIEKGLDTGPVFGVVTETIRPWDTAGDLLDRLSTAGAGLMVATMDGIADGSLVARPQSEDGVSIAGKITVADARVDWSAPAQHIDRLIRSCTPAPGAWTELAGERIKLGPGRIRAGSPDRGEPGGNPDRVPPGELLVGKSRILVGTATDPFELGTVQPAGKRPVPAADWARGSRVETGTRLG